MNREWNSEQFTRSRTQLDMDRATLITIMQRWQGERVSAMKRPMVRALEEGGLAPTAVDDISSRFAAALDKFADALADAVRSASTAQDQISEARTSMQAIRNTEGGRFQVN